jgi:diphthamide biosynthesis protein 7
VTTSTGLSRLLRLDDRWKIAAVVDIDIGNSLEAWSIAFAPGPGSVAAPVGLTTVYTGGDDSVLRYNSYLLTSDYDEELVAEEPSFDPISIKGQHDAGVTAILPLALHESSGGRLVVTGSYDDHVRLFAIHDPQETYGMKRVQRLAEKNLEGGVWRLDLVDAVSSEGSVEIRILASCMYAGARLIQISQGPDGTWSCEVLARLQEHQSMNYGCAIVPRKQGDHKLVCVSTSFYDKLVCLWEYKL